MRFGLLCVNQTTTAVTMVDYSCCACAAESAELAFNKICICFTTSISKDAFPIYARLSAHLYMSEGYQKTLQLYRQLQAWHVYYSIFSSLVSSCSAVYQPKLFLYHPTVLRAHCLHKQGQLQYQSNTHTAYLSGPEG